MADKVTKSEISKVPFSKLSIVEGLNIREDYGNVKELADQIRENGILVPVRGYVEGDQYCIVDGHRRYKACELIFNEDQLDVVIPFIKQARGTNAEQTIIEMFVSNEGKPLTPLEQSTGIMRLINAGWEEKDIAQKTGKSQTYIHRLVYLNNAPKKAKTLIKKGIVSATTVIDLVKDDKIDKFLEKESWVKTGAAESNEQVTTKTAKVTKKHLFINSFADLKRFLKAHDQSTFANKAVEDDFWLLTDVVNNALSYDDFATYFLEGKYPTANETNSSKKSNKQKDAAIAEEKAA